METKITEKENGYLIQVNTDQEIALAIQSEQGERIYLPGEGGSDSTYYSENPTFLAKTENGYTVLHSEKPEEVEVLN